jgi:hypothetical protein
MRNFFIRLVIEFSLALVRELAKLIRKRIEERNKKAKTQARRKRKGSGKIK